ncbi:MAG TPA: microcystin degradation protein MlrC [Gammaproteobacteria bacterium]|nr:microcystin degradation protein MlrC [Gammaproteobacteria bacterium]
MKIGIAMMSHETNTFSPVITDLDRFSGGHGEPLRGDTALNTYRGTASCLGGYIEVAEQHDVAIEMGIAAAAPPSGPVEDDAFEYMCAAIVELSGRVDALLLDLHGAMTTKSFDDGEGELLRRIRADNPALPIAISLDMHANITELMVSNCDVLTGYHTYPHIDMDSTAVRGARAFFAMLQGAAKPVLRWGNAPMLPHVMRQGTDDEPNASLQARAIALEQAGCLGISVFTGFPHADIYDAGFSVVAMTEGDSEAAQGYVNELLTSAWEAREDFVYEVEPLPESMQRAQAAASAAGDGPVIVLDHYDNTASGGTMDTTEVLSAVLEAGLERVAVFGFYDPEVVAQMTAAGVGATVTVELGGKLPMPALAEQSKPITLTGEVKLISNGKFQAQVAMARGLTINMGTSAVLSVGSVDIAIISRHIEPYDPECFRSLGMEPLAYDYVMLKSRIHYRVGFRDLAKEVIECAGCGVCTSDYSQLTFDKVRRPVYPLDQDGGGANEAWQIPGT